MDRARRLLRAAPIVLTAVIAGIVGSPDDPSQARTRSAAKPPLEQRIGLRPGLQLAAMRAAISAAPSYFPNYKNDCASLTPVIAYQDGGVMAGNFKDSGQGCYLWLNLAHSPLLTGQEICKLALHEMGHLGGLQHSQDQDDVMYSPFESRPVPTPCTRPFGPTASNR